MSERGSFVTEYLYCKSCLAGAWDALSHVEVEAVTMIHSIYHPFEPIIIAGKASGLAAGDELRTFEAARRIIEPRICHDVTIAVIPDRDDPKFFVYSPSEESS